MDAVINLSATSGVLIDGCVFYEAYDNHGVIINGDSNTVTRNLMLKSMRPELSKSNHAIDRPASFFV